MVLFFFTKIGIILLDDMGSPEKQPRYTLPREPELFSNNPRREARNVSRRCLVTGEEFYTNVSEDGFAISSKEHITLDQYVDELKGKFERVVVNPVAYDSQGRPIEGSVAIFVKRKPDEAGKS